MKWLIFKFSVSVPCCDNQRRGWFNYLGQIFSSHLLPILFCGEHVGIFVFSIAGMYGYLSRKFAFSIFWVVFRFLPCLSRVIFSPSKMKIFLIPLLFCCNHGYNIYFNGNLWSSHGNAHILLIFSFYTNIPFNNILMPPLYQLGCSIFFGKSCIYYFFNSFSYFEYANYCQISNSFSLQFSVSSTPFLEIDILGSSSNILLTITSQYFSSSSIP